MVFRKILTHKWPLVISLAMISGLYYWIKYEQQKMHNVQFILGWGLTAMAFLMASYNARKVLSILPLGRLNSWYLFHLYGGLFTSILFIYHAGLYWPESPISQALWLGSILILISGMIGFLLTKLLTPSISTQGERFIFDRIPGHISRTRELSQELLIEAAGSQSGKPIVDYYNKNLLKFFNYSGQLGLRIFSHKKRLDKHCIELKEIGRYLDEENKIRLHELLELIKQKSMLDWQYSMLSILRQWTLLHVPIIWFTFIILLVHIMIQYAFEITTPW